MRSPFRGYGAPLLVAALWSPFVPALAESTPNSAPVAASSVFVEPELTLDQAVRLALNHNPELASARLEIQAMEGAKIQAGARPNPEIGVLVEDTRTATRTTTLQWVQPIELGGKRAARLAAAARALDQANVGLQAKQAETRSAVTSAFFEVLGAQEQVRLVQASLELARNATSIADKRLQAGKVPPLELAKAKVAESGVRAELAQSNSELQLARQRLSAFWGQGKIAFSRVGGNAEALPDMPLDQRLNELLSQAPSIRMAQLDVARRQALTDSERAKRVPDLTVTLGVKRANDLGRTQAVMGLSIPLPIMDSNQGNLLEALRREDQAREALTATTLKLQSDVSQSMEKLRLTREQVKLLRTEVLPTAQSAYDAAAKGYELGKFAFLEVLDAQRTLFQLRQQMLRSTAEAYSAAADLDRLLGQDARPTGQNQE